MARKPVGYTDTLYPQSNSGMYCLSVVASGSLSVLLCNLAHWARSSVLHISHCWKHPTVTAVCTAQQHKLATYQFWFRCGLVPGEDQIRLRQCGSAVNGMSWSYSLVEQGLSSGSSGQAHTKLLVLAKHRCVQPPLFTPQWLVPTDEGAGDKSDTHTHTPDWGKLIGGRMDVTEFNKKKKQSDQI